MPEIFHKLLIHGPTERVFSAVSTPEGLNAWWTKDCRGRPAEGEEYELSFGPGYDWKGLVTRAVGGKDFEIEITKADDDWTGTRVGFSVTGDANKTDLSFYHKGWPERNDHFKISSYCWAAYLRLLKKYVENGDVVPYEQRYEA